MIRRLEKEDMGQVIQIWLKANLKAHGFISENYWKGNFEAVKEMLPQAEVYVYEEECEKEIQGFIGINDNYIEGIFVDIKVQSRGIGKKLMDHAKNMKPQLTLSVYRKNEAAVRFYHREEFKIQAVHLDESTGEEEYIMEWKGKSFFS